MDSNKLKVALIVVVATIAAFYLGVAAATAHTEAIAWVVGALSIVLFLALGKHIWILIPITLGLEGSINAIPGSPPPWWIATAVACGMLTLRFVMRSKDFIFRLTWMDFAIFLQLLAIAQAWIRFPAGLSLFGGDTVGGKFNFIFLLAGVAYAALSTIKTNLKMVKTAVHLMIAVGAMAGLLYILTEISPAVAMIVLPIYSGSAFTTGEAVAGAAAVVSDGARYAGGAQLGKALGLAVLTLFRPLSLLNPIHFGRFSIFMLSLAAIMISGFRSALIMFAIYFIVVTIVRRKYMDLLLGGVAAFLLVALLAVTGTATKLPYSAQRVLSFLPIQVSEAAARNSEDSSEWRFEMWRLALTTDKYIQNKILGDGVGYRADELRAGQDSMAGDMRRSRGMTMQEAMLVRGSFHGFHVETIRCTGILGLLLALIGMGIFFHTAWRMIRYYKYHPEWGYVLYLCVPFLIYPFYYMLVFGSYRSSFPLLLVGAGMLKLLDNIRYQELHTLLPDKNQLSNDAQPAQRPTRTGIPQISPS